MSKTLLLKKATRIEGNANIQVQVEDGKIRAARFLVHEFRGFETFVTGRRIEYVPQLVSRICGLCSVSHQVASLRAIEQAISLKASPSVEKLRDAIVLGEWIGSHALSYFFLNMPDVVGGNSGIFDLIEQSPQVGAEAFALRKAGLRIVELLGKRSSHPVSLGLGRFLIPPTPAEIEEVQSIARNVRDRTARLIAELAEIYKPLHDIPFPRDIKVNFIAHDSYAAVPEIKVFEPDGRVAYQFAVQDLEENISEMRTDWSLAKIPYLSKMGFPDGIMLVGPLSRSFLGGGFMSDPEVRKFELSSLVSESAEFTLDIYDICRLLEIFWASRRILTLLEGLDSTDNVAEPDLGAVGKGIGILEAPRGLLMHSYVVNQGCVEKMKLLVATQFNNAYINLLITDLAQKNLSDDRLSFEGERLIGRCVRLLDPCLSCATH
jgi:coenzyme F420-reducing hydrogenase alpha subunit